MSSLRTRLAAVVTSALMISSSFALTTPAQAAAATLNVTNCLDSGAGSLRAQIAAASAGDTINLDATTMGCTQISLLTDLTVDKNLTITGSTKNLSLTTITADATILPPAPYTSADAKVLPEVTITRGGGKVAGNEIVANQAGGWECRNASVLCGNSNYGKDVALLNVEASVSNLSVQNLIFDGGAAPYVSGVGAGFTPSTKALISIKGLSTEPAGARNITFTNDQVQNAYRTDGGSAGIEVLDDSSALNYATNLTISKGLLTYLKAGLTSNGAALNIAKTNVTLNVDHTTFNMNAARGGKGGSIYIKSDLAKHTTATFVNVNIMNGHASKAGAGLAVDGVETVNITGANISRNALYLPCAFEQFKSNCVTGDRTDATNAEKGAAIWAMDVKNLNVKFAAFSNNQTDNWQMIDQYGGAIYADTSNPSNEQHVVIDSSAFYANAAPIGSGAYSAIGKLHGADIAVPAATDVLVKNSSFFSPEGGGTTLGSDRTGLVGIYTGSPLTKIINSAFIGNTTNAGFYASQQAIPLFEKASASSAQIYLAASVVSLDQQGGNACGSNDWVVDRGANIFIYDAYKCVTNTLANLGSQTQGDSAKSSTYDGGGTDRTTYESELGDLGAQNTSYIYDYYWDMKFWNERIGRYNKVAFVPPQLKTYIAYNFMTGVRTFGSVTNFYPADKTFVLGPDGTTPETSPALTGRGLPRPSDSLSDVGPTEYLELAFEMKNESGLVQGFSMTTYKPTNTVSWGATGTAKVTTNYLPLLANLQVNVGTYIYDLTKSFDGCNQGIFRLSDFVTPKSASSTTYFCNPAGTTQLTFYVTDRVYDAYYTMVKNGSGMMCASNLGRNLLLLATSSTSVVASWDGAAGATSYTVQNAAGTKSCTATAPATTCTITGLTDSDSPLYLRTTTGGTQQSLASSQSSTAFYSTWSAPSVVTPPDVPTASVSGSTITVTVPSKTNAQYYAMYSEPAGMVCKSRYQVNTCTFTTGYTSGTGYTFKYAYLNLDDFKWTAFSGASNSVVGPATTPAISPSSQTLSGVVGTALTASSAITASSITGTVTYAISPALPAGLTMSTSTGVISGTPSAVSASRTYTITGTGSTSGSATATVVLAVTAAPVASVSPSAATLTGGTGIAVTPNASFSTTNISGTVTYALSGGSLPNGLSFDPTTGVISGTPTVALARKVFTVTATGSVSGSATATIAVTIAATPGYVPTPDPTGDGTTDFGSSVNTGGGKFTITGTNLVGVSTVTVDGVLAVIKKNADGSITVTIPAGTTGTANVVLNYGGGSFAGTVTAGTLEYIGVAKLNQTITFSSGASTYTLSDPVRSYTATSDSGLAVTVTSKTPAVCNIANGLVLFIANGKCTVTATQAGDPGTNAATPVTNDIYVEVRFVSADPLYSVNAGGSKMTIKGTGLRSVTKVLFGTIEVAGTALKPSADGSSMTVTIPANPDGLTASTKTVDLTLDVSGSSIDTHLNFTWVGPVKVAQTITAPTQPSNVPTNATYGDDPINLNGASNNSTIDPSNPLAVNLTYRVLTPRVCAVVNGVLRYLTSGTCTFTTASAANAGLLAGPASAPVTVVIAKKNQSITLQSSSTMNVTTATPGQIEFDLDSSDDGMVTDLSSASPLVCDVDGDGVVTGYAAGTCVITLAQAGDARYNAATSVTVTVTISVDSSTVIPDAEPTDEDLSDPQGIANLGPNTYVANNSGLLLAWDKAKGILKAQAKGTFIGYIDAKMTFTVDSVEYSCEIVFGTTKALPSRTAAQKKAAAAKKTFTAKYAFCADPSKLSVPTGSLTTAQFAKIKAVAKTKTEKAAEALAASKLKGFTGTIRLDIIRYRAWYTTMVNVRGNDKKGAKIPFTHKIRAASLQ
ncbi:MAG: putative Ig domain-containing protein [Micrococcales bacterium]